MRWLACKLAGDGSAGNKAHDVSGRKRNGAREARQENDMKIISISTRGVQPVAATKTRAKNGAAYYALTHGEEGRGRWQIRIPLAAREFPAPADAGERFPLDGEYKLVDLRKHDPRGNPLHLLALGREDGQQLVMWSLSPGYRGGASCDVAGRAKAIAQGEEAQGDAGRMGGAVCPVVLVDGPCRLSWHRSGRLYGSEADWIAEFDGDTWTVAPSHLCAAEEAALNY